MLNEGIVCKSNAGEHVMTSLPFMDDCALLLYSYAFVVLIIMLRRAHIIYFGAGQIMQFASRNIAVNDLLKQHSRREVYDVKFAGSLNYIDEARLRMELKTKIIV